MSFVSKALAVLVVATPLTALAQARTDPAAAEALFNDAKVLMKNGAYEAACPKFAASLRLDQGVGTQLALALCYEQAGKTASAWATYREVVASARQAGQPDREKIAQQRSAALFGQLAYVTIMVPDAVASTPGLTVRRDGIDVSSAAFGTATPVDAGEHVVTVAAPAKRPVTLTVSVSRAETQSVTVPLLEDAPAEPAPVANDALVSTMIAPDSTTKAPPPKEGRSSSKVLAFGLLGAGALGIGAGSFFGLRAIDASSESKDLCSAGACARRDDALARHDDAVTSANVANIAFGIGIVAAIAGTYLLLTSGTSPRVTAGASSIGGRL